jgi:hypothetical protein
MIASYWNNKIKLVLNCSGTDWRWRWWSKFCRTAHVDKSDVNQLNSLFLDTSIMNTLFRQFTRTTAFRNTSFTLCKSLARPAQFRHPNHSTLLHARTVASFVTNKPASQSLEHAATNIKEEVGNSAADFARVIAGDNATKDSVIHGEESFVSPVFYRRDRSPPNTFRESA